jgi:hypothetical protein
MSKDKIYDKETGAIYKNVFLFQTHSVPLIVPFEKLENFEILLNLDLSYFHQKCRYILS